MSEATLLEPKIPQIYGKEKSRPKPTPKKASLHASFDQTDDGGLKIYLDADVLDREKIKQALALMHEALRENCVDLSDIDDSHLPVISDEEQAEIETILDVMADEDKEIISTHYLRRD